MIFPQSVLLRQVSYQVKCCNISYLCETCTNKARLVHNKAQLSCGALDREKSLLKQRVTECCRSFPPSE